MKAKYNWDIVIARGLGCSKQRVNQRRKEFGKVNGPNYRKHKVHLFNKLLEMKTEDKTLEEISRVIGYAPISIRNILDEHKKGYIFIDRRKGGKYAWDTADWTMTDKEVAYKLGVPNWAVVYQKRRRLGVTKNVIKFAVAKKEKNVSNVNKETIKV
jgi:hypothetical protein